MKLFSLVLATVALALPLAARDTGSSAQCVATITDYSYKIGNQTQKVGDIANKVKANRIFTLLSLQVETSKLITIIQNAGNDVNSSCPQLTLNEALPLVTVLSGLSSPVKSTMDTLVGKKSVFDRAILYFVSLSWLVKCDLDSVISAVNGFAYACRSHVPTAAAGIVDNLVKTLVTPIVTAQSTFADNNGLINLAVKTKNF